MNTCDSRWTSKHLTFLATCSSPSSIYRDDNQRSGLADSPMLPGGSDSSSITLKLFTPVTCAPTFRIIFNPRFTISSCVSYSMGMLMSHICGSHHQALFRFGRRVVLILWRFWPYWMRSIIPTIICRKKAFWLSFRLRICRSSWLSDSHRVCSKPIAFLYVQPLWAGSFWCVCCDR